MHEVDEDSLENLPEASDGAAYQWIDLHGEGIPGILTNRRAPGSTSAISARSAKQPVEFAPLERVATQARTSALAGGQAQFMDLAGDGQPDLVVLDGPRPAFTNTTRRRAGSRSVPSPRASTATCATRT